ncbi:hypothetical protein BH10PLA2_BH10PLA2_27140 [soil metagenome]
MAGKARKPRTKVQPTTFEVQDELDDCPPVDEEVAPEGEAPGVQARQFTDRCSNSHPRHQIDIGAGKKMHLIRNQRFFQNAISFEGAGGESITPEKADAEWLEQRGWKERPEEKVWTKQLERNTDSQRYARANSDRSAQNEFVELGNLLRQRRGMVPIDYEFSQARRSGR